MTKSRQALDGKIVGIRPGLAIYKIHASPYYYCRIWLPGKKKRLVRTTKATTRAEAIGVAEELFKKMDGSGDLAQVPMERTFRHFADRLVVLDRKRGENGRISTQQWKNSKNLLNNPTWGPMSYFGARDIAEIRARDYVAYMSWVSKQSPKLTAGTRNHIAVVFRKVMSLAQNDGIIDAVPPTPREKRKDNPRAFFRFYPLVNKQNDEYELLKTTAKKMAQEGALVRGVKITEELHDFIVFMIQSFLRPTESEIYALRYRDVTIASNPKRLILTIRKGKTGQRISNTLAEANSLLGRMMARNDAKRVNEYLFLPEYTNRSTAKRIMQRQFNAVLERAGLKKDDYSGTMRTVYSLRHTAICMRLVLSEGKVNIFNLAKNAGTSVDQIERFYAHHLPLSAEMAKNLQSVGS
jgi:hypothetical protein